LSVVAFIFARGGSKGLPGKNTRNFNGKPLIAWSIAHAQEISRINRIFVSTDSHEIASVARDYGAEVPFMRPHNLAQDESPEWESWRHALDYLKKTQGEYPKAMVSVPATAPLREPQDIEKCLDVFEKGESDAVITISEARRSPYFNMVKKLSDGTVGLVISPDSIISRRQDTPSVYEIATNAYVLNPEFVMNKFGLFEGRVHAVEIPAERSIDIDTLLDFEIAKYIQKHGIGND